MLDYTSSTMHTAAGLIDRIYAHIIDDSDVVAAVRAICEAYDAHWAALFWTDRGSEMCFAAHGEPLSDIGAARSLRLDGCSRGDGRRVMLKLQFAGPVDAATEGHFASLMANIDRAVSLAWRLGCASIERSIGSDLLDRLSVGTVYLDAERRVVGTTGMARSLIENGGILVQRAGRLAAAQGNEDRKLQEAIRTVVGSSSRTRGEILRVYSPCSERVLGIVVQPIPAKARQTGIACALVIRDSERPATPEQDMLRDLFDLTPAEANLTSILSRGLTLDEAAAELAISRNTARAHLRAIFSKCGIKRQTELVRLVLGSVAMLGGQKGKGPEQDDWTALVAA